MTILVEGFEFDAIALARLLAREGNEVRLASNDDEPKEGTDLRELGIRIEANVNLDSDPGPAEIAYLDVWTPEIAPRAQRLRAQGTRVSCLGDLLLERWHGPTIGITGTAGKTATTSLTAAILRAAGIDVAVSRGARAGNLWPTGDLLDRLQAEAPDSTVLLLELTSSHLAFMRSSPTIAAVISFWPDHLELHGDLARYRAAKETIVRHQRAGDMVIVNADDASANFVTLTPADPVAFSLRQRVNVGAYLDSARGIVVVEQDGSETALGTIHESTPHPGNAVAAAAIASAAGANPEAIVAGIRASPTLPWRAQSVGTLAGIPVVDDGMAATPLKTVALLSVYPDHSVVLIAGGRTDAGGGTVHATAEEHALLERACDEIARAVRIAVLFGDAGTRLVKFLDVRHVQTRVVRDLAAAVAVAEGHAAGAAAVVFSPLFPLSHEQRASFGELVCSRSRVPHP